jgi:lipopolysaccharide/colanic/teichoic acid biosynthesis glycosyltransferase
MQQAALTDSFEVQLSPGFYEILTTSVQVTHKAFVPLLRVEQARITGIDLMLKVVLDYGLGLLLVLLTLPLTLLLGLAIGPTGGWPIIERQQVYGLGGSLFRTTRFRTGLRAGLTGD